VARVVALVQEKSLRSRIFQMLPYLRETLMPTMQHLNAGFNRSTYRCFCHVNYLYGVRWREAAKKMVR
jgi:hypothetical protein